MVSSSSSSITPWSQLELLNAITRLAAITLVVLPSALAAPLHTTAAEPYEVVARGFDALRGLAFALNGALYVAEVGRGIFLANGR